MTNTTDVIKMTEPYRVIKKNLAKLSPNVTVEIDDLLLFLWCGMRTCCITAALEGWMMGLSHCYIK